MDATNQKAIAGVFVALLVGSVLVGLVPTATAVHLGGEDITINLISNAKTVHVEGIGSFTNVAIPTSPAGFKLRHSTAYSLFFTGINVGGSGYGYAGAAGSVELVNASSSLLVGSGSLVQGDDGPGGQLRNASIVVSASSVLGPGAYELRAGSNVVANILFWPKEEITVSAANFPGGETSFPYSPTGTTIRVQTTTPNVDLTDCPIVSTAGTPQSCAGFLLAPNKTQADGTFTFVSSLPMGAGTWRIWAYQNNSGPLTSPTTGFSIPEQIANTSFTVTANALDLAPVAETAFVGFDNQIAYQPKFPGTGNKMFHGESAFPSDVPCGSGTACFANISVLTPNNLLVFANATYGTGDVLGPGAGVLSLNGTVECKNLTTGAIGCGTAGVGAWINRADGTLYFVPLDDNATANSWTTGTYTVGVSIDTAGGQASAPEYTVSRLLPVNQPAAVNVIVSPTTVDVPVTSSNPSAISPVSAAQGVVTITATISGQSKVQHPLCNLGGACASGEQWETDTDFTDNITLRGAVLPGWKVQGYDKTTGIATILATPSANGTIHMDVAWKNVTTTTAIPVGRGANITVDVSNITVDQTSTVTVTVRSAGGDLVSTANVYVFPRVATLTTTTPPASAFQGTGATFVFGNGGAGTGANGQYTFNLRPTAPQDLTFYAVIGTSPNINYSYAPLTVLPAQNLNVVLNNTMLMAAQRTPLFLNVTNSTHALTSTDANLKAYFLTSTHRADLLNNGTTSLFTKTGSLLPVANTTANGFANGTYLNVTLAAGDYSLYVCYSASTIADCRTATHDNRLNMPIVNVSAYTATFNPPQIANNVDIQGATSINIQVTDRNGAPANGTIRVKTNSTLVTQGVASGTVTNGQVNITLTGANTGVGNIEWEFNPDDIGGTSDSMYDTVNGVLGVVAGNLTFSPTKVPILQSTLVTVKLTNFTGAGLPGRVIRLCGVSLNSNFPTTAPTNLLTPTDVTANCPAIGTTEADGTTGIVVTPTSLTPITVYVNNSNTGRTLPVTAGSLAVTISPTAPTAGDDVTITVSQPGGTPSTGSRILVTKNGTTVLDTTADGNGKGTLADVSAGTYVITGIRSGFDNGTATFTVGAPPANVSAVFEVSNLVLPSTATVGTPITVTADVENTGTGSGTATAVLLVNNAQRDTQIVTLDAGDTTTVAFTFTPTVAGTFAVNVRVGDSTPGPQNVVVSSATTTPTPTTPTPTTPTPTTPTPTTPTPTTPTPTTPTPTTPTATPPTPPPPTVPGFEVVALIAALGAAMLVLRRRN